MKRVFLSVVISIFISFCFISPIHAQDATGSWVDTGYPASMEAAASGDVNAAAHVSNVNTNTYSDFTRRVLGPVEGITVSVGQMNSPYAQSLYKQSALYSLAGYIADIYVYPPASTYAYIRDVGQTLGFMPKQAYAQGIGFTGLTSLLPLWKAFRNISYGILAIIMIIIGFMVMFRKKIDPKTVVTVQNALPKIVISLILITFSYAIVGLMIDAMYLVIYLVASLFLQAVPAAFSGQNVINSIVNGNLSNVWQGLWQGASASKAIATLIAPTGNFFNWLSSGLISTVLSLAVLFMFIRVLFMLVGAYMQIIFALLLAPLQFLLEAIPGGKGFSSWFKNLISNLIVFPITAAMFLIGSVLVYMSGTPGSLWTPPFLGAGTQSSGIIGIIALGVILAIPTTVKGIQEAMKAKPMVNVGMGAVLGPVGSSAGQLMQLGYQLSFMKQAMSHTKVEDTPKQTKKTGA